MTDYTIQDQPMKSGSAEWLQARVGKLTASRFADATYMTMKGKSSAARTDYLTEKVCERLTGTPYPQYVSLEMRWGSEHENEAVEAYVNRRIAGRVEPCGFFVHPTCDYAGASPDGLVERYTWDAEEPARLRPLLECGLIEVKCPYNSANHIATWLHGMPKEHMAQVQGQMWVTGRGWADFISYDPRMPEGLDLYVERIPRDPEYIEELQTALAKAWLDVLEIEATIVDAAMRQSQLLGLSEPYTRLERQLAGSLATLGSGE